MLSGAKLKTDNERSEFGGVGKLPDRFIILHVILIYMFTKYVSPETAYRATFNYYEPSFPIDKDGRNFMVYHTKHPVWPEPNIVVIEAIDDREELYFRAFIGKHSGECETESEAQPYYEEIRRSISPEFRVSGRYLEKRILQLLDEIDKGRFSN